MQLKIKYANDLDGEYTTVDISTKTDIVDIIKVYPWEQERDIVNGIIGFKGSPGITIQKPNGDSISINSFQHYDTLLYNLDLSYRKFFYWDQIYSVRNTFDDLIELVLCFVENESSILNNRIKHGRHFILPAYIRISLRKRISRSEKTINLKTGRYKKYKFNYKKSIHHLILSALFIHLSIFGILSMYFVTPLFFIMAIMCFLIGFPPFVIFYNHYKCYNSTAVILRLNENRFSIYRNSNHEVFDKSKIIDVYKVISKTGERSPWSYFFLWRISFKDGKQAIISSLVMSQSDILREFDIWPNKTEATHFLPLVKKTIAL